MEASFRSLSFLSLFLAFLFLPNFFFFCTGLSDLRCIDTERHALLTFKQDLIDPLNRLSSWTVDGDCCHWLGVVCHNLTGHVDELHLRTSYPEGDFENGEQYEAYRRTMFGGPILVDLQNMTSLSHLNLSGNNFNSSTPNWLYRFSRLEFLNLRYNNLQGTISSAIGNLTSAISIDLSRNELGGKLPRSLGNLCNLREIRLSWNKWSQEISEILESLSGCLSDRLEILDLSDSQLHGHLTDELGISDMAPPSFWNLSSQFRYLNLSHNLINEEIPNSPVILFALAIDLSSNHFKGIIPDCLMNWNNLVVLNLGNNNFSGSIPASIGSLTNLNSLHLCNNTFSGILPSSLKSCEELVIIDVAENRFAGNIPSWIGHRCTSLMVLSLRSNYFHGHIPKELCALTSLQILDLSHNKLSGSIPRCVKNFRAMATNNISNEHLNSYRASIRYGEILPLESALLVIKGSIREYNTILQLVKSIDFSKNNLLGEIPKEVTSLQELQSLNLSCNFLNGSIPMNIGTMVLLESIDFSMNHLSGKIPSSMSSLTFLSHLNLSNNNLSGKIPLSTQLQSLAASSFIGNNLCGPPLKDNCTVNGVKPNYENTTSKDTNGLEVDWFYVSMALGFVVGFWGVCSSLLLNKPWRIMYFQFLDHLGYKLKSIVSL
uniref:Leucine-rich repeat-containing N-terminal plant-type domain-containing protein n=2 Tax=Quercus lobata TaxID=97700 RepID=A0A7N2MI36_QUELO